MSLTRGTVNALNVLSVRRLGFIPNHFTKMTLRAVHQRTQIENWIYQNLDSRYAIEKSLKIDANNKLIEEYEIGIEDPRELTMLSLSCPYLNVDYTGI